jgi:hypothetical protein
MGELKVYRDLEDYVAFDEKDCPPEVYDKVEVDKVIAEKDTKIIQLEAFIENHNRISGEIIGNANHQKYRRCLNNAWWILREEFFAEDCRDERRVNWAIRWYKRWMELADKFKEKK